MAIEHFLSSYRTAEQDDSRSAVSLTLGSRLVLALPSASLLLLFMRFGMCHVLDYVIQVNYGTIVIRFVGGGARFGWAAR